MSLSPDEAWVLRRFLELYYEGPGGTPRPFEVATWMGVPALKCPLDLWIYQELLFQRRPNLIVETGTRFGGTTLYLAHLCDLLGHGRIVSIDIEELPRPEHPRITYLLGSSTDPAILGRVAAMRPAEGRTVVILDSDHQREHVDAELEGYAPLLSPGDYLIVEDTNINGHPVAPSHGPGPHEAVEGFLERHPEFSRDRSREKFLLTFNPGGFLERTRPLSEAATDVRHELSKEDAHVDPYEPVAGEDVETVALVRRRAELTTVLQAQLAEVAPAFEQAMTQLQAAQEVGVRFDEAVSCLALAAEREQRLGTQLADVTAAFQEAMRQLDVSQRAGEHFEQAVALLKQANAREVDLRARVLMLEEELSRAHAFMAQSQVPLRSSAEELPTKDDLRALG